jgi:hypothetical protein
MEIGPKKLATEKRPKFLSGLTKNDLASPHRELFPLAFPVDFQVGWRV